MDDPEIESKDKFPALGIGLGIPMDRMLDVGYGSVEIQLPSNM